jgi:hypothetical protein
MSDKYFFFAIRVYGAKLVILVIASSLKYFVFLRRHLMHFPELTIKILVTVVYLNSVMPFGPLNRI